MGGRLDELPDGLPGAARKESTVFEAVVTLEWAPMDSRLTRPIASIFARLSRAGLGAVLEVTWMRLRAPHASHLSSPVWPSSGTVENFFAIAGDQISLRPMQQAGRVYYHR